MIDDVKFVEKSYCRSIFLLQGGKTECQSPFYGFELKEMHRNNSFYLFDLFPPFLLWQKHDFVGRPFNLCQNGSMTRLACKSVLVNWINDQWIKPAHCAQTAWASAQHQAWSTAQPLFAFNYKTGICSFFCFVFLQGNVRLPCRDLMCLLVIKLWLWIKRWLTVTDTFRIQVLLFLLP